MKTGDEIKVTRGKYRGCIGTFVETATEQSCRVKIKGEVHTLRRTSIEPNQILDCILEDIEMIRMALTKLELKVNKLKRN